MAKQQGTLVSALYESEDRAQVMLDEIKRMAHNDVIKVLDAAALVKDLNGKIHVRETKELTAKKGAERGALITGLVSMLFPAGLIASAVAGGLGGAVVGMLRDSGIKKDTINSVTRQIDVGKAAVVVLTNTDSVTKVEQTLQANEGELIEHPTSQSHTSSSDTTNGTATEPTADDRSDSPVQLAVSNSPGATNGKPVTKADEKPLANPPTSESEAPPKASDD